jgi:hypothetical protein
MRATLLTLLALVLPATGACATTSTERSPTFDPAAQAVSGSATLDASSASAFGIELQAYPAGVIAGLHGEYALSERDVLTARLAWNETDRGDFGEHDDEQGGGPGGGIGWRRFLGAGRSGWLFGARVDVWQLEIDWEDDLPAAREGTTDVLVVQPSLEAGYRWRLGDSRWTFDLTGSLGVELNVDTDGEDVGEGPIGLIGATLTYGL